MEFLRWIGIAGPGEITEKSDGVKIGAEFIVQVGGDEFACAVDGALLIDAVDEDDNDRSREKERENPEEAVEVSFLLGVADLEQIDDSWPFFFEIVAE